MLRSGQPVARLSLAYLATGIWVLIFTKIKAMAAVQQQGVCRRSGSFPEISDFLAMPGFEESPEFLLAGFEEGNKRQALPPRSGSRPECQSCLPHAQMTDQTPDEIFDFLVERATVLMKEDTEISRSHVSMPSTFPAFHLRGSTKMPKEARMIHREFAHIHKKYLDDDHPIVIAATQQGQSWQSYQGGGQGSMHMCLSLKDAATVIKSGWGEPHILAGKDMGGMKLARGLLLVYAPRTFEEVDTVLKILRASLSFAKSEISVKSR